MQEGGKRRRNIRNWAADALCRTAFAEILKIRGSGGMRKDVCQLDQLAAPVARLRPAWRYLAPMLALQASGKVGAVVAY